MADFYKEIMECPYCNNEFTYTKIMTHAIAVESYDSDLKPNYKSANPNLYSMITCPKCNFTFIERDKDLILQKMSPKKFDNIGAYLSSLGDEDLKNYDNTGDKSIGVYKKQLIVSAEIYAIMGLPFTVARQLIKLAWQYRENDDDKRELKILNNVFKLLKNSFEKAYSDEDTIFTYFYLGYVSYRLGNISEAANYFDRLVSGYRNSNNPYVKAAKELRSDLK